MKMNMEFDVVLFNVPGSVIQTQVRDRLAIEYKQVRSFTLAEISEEILSKLCEQFREDVFKKAGKVDPKLSIEN